MAVVPQPDTIERVLQRVQTVIEGRERISVGFVGMGDGGEVHDRVRTQIVDQSTDHLVVAQIGKQSVPLEDHHDTHDDHREAHELEAEANQAPLLESKRHRQN